ncbi:DUF1254 domain-containing protein [Gordonia sp. CPCC 205515]|uniref:DUF1254 domain-containing protein n=1 Tax=Gordonia sp. CPCC 205515 TaxID=3140791 RepID=UPI003AF3980F
MPHPSKAATRRVSAKTGVVAAFSALATTLSLGVGAIFAPVSAQAAPASSAVQAAANGYVYGVAPVAVVRTRSNLLCNRAPNTLINLPIPANASIREIVAPNSDTLYSNAFLDLRKGPVTLSFPASNGRYVVLQFLDAYTNVIGNIGSRTTGFGPTSVTVVPPGYRGPIPAGSHRLQSTTWDVWMLGRILVTGNQWPLAQVLQAQTRLTVGPRVGYPAVVPPGLKTPTCTGRSPQKLNANGTVFFDELADVLAADPPPAADRAAVASLASVGVTPGSHPSTGPRAAALAAGMPVGDRLVDSAVSDNLIHHSAWTTLATAGHFGTDYATRAAVARWALAANEQSESRYFLSAVDNSGSRYNGSKSYRLHLPARNPLAPVNSGRGGWWSVTMYDASDFLVPNPIGRYSLGSNPAALTRNPDGSVDLVMSSTPPRDPRMFSNWLPAPAGPFRLIFRQYVPSNLQWFPPSPVRVS